MTTRRKAGSGRAPDVRERTRALLFRVVAWGEVPPGSNPKPLALRLQLLAAEARALLRAVDGRASNTERG